MPFQQFPLESKALGVFAHLVVALVFKTTRTAPPLTTQVLLPLCLPRSRRKAARMANNPAYQRIIALGMAAVPLILAELRQRPDHWFVALHTITGANPVPPESRTVQEMANAWLAWGIAEGYIEYHADRP